MIRLRRFLLSSALPLLLLAKAGAAVVVTYRGDAPNIFTPMAVPSDNGLDINGDGILDYRFHTDGSFVAAMMGYGTNQFISTLSVPPDRGGDITPVQAGSIIGADTAALGGSWYHHTDNAGNPNLSTGFSLWPLQHTSAYISVAFEVEGEIHYGWIHYIGFDSPDNDYILPGVPGGFINAWAWETEPGKPIVAGGVPEPQTALLALAGSLALASCRRRQALRA